MSKSKQAEDSLVQALRRRTETQKEEIRRLEARIDELEQMVEELRVLEYSETQQ